MWGMERFSLALYRRFQPVIAPNAPSAPYTPMPPNTTVVDAAGLKSSEQQKKKNVPRFEKRGAPDIAEEPVAFCGAEKIFSLVLAELAAKKVGLRRVPIFSRKARRAATGYNDSATVKHSIKVGYARCSLCASKQLHHKWGGRNRIDV